MATLSSAQISFDDAETRKKFYESCIQLQQYDKIEQVLRNDPAFKQLTPNFNAHLRDLEELWPLTAMIRFALSIGIQEAIQFLSWFKTMRIKLRKEARFHFLWAIRASLNDITNYDGNPDLKSFIQKEFS